MPGKEAVFFQRINENFYTYIIKIFFQKRKFFEGIYKKITNKELFDNKQRLSVKLEYDKNGREVLRKFGNGTSESTLYMKIV